jgi:hypothetical protein
VLVWRIGRPAGRVSPGVMIRFQMPAVLHAARQGGRDPGHRRAPANNTCLLSVYDLWCSTAYTKEVDRAIDIGKFSGEPL